jgi:Reverse transcriptase (RNA-dependent DNA polymerase)
MGYYHIELSPHAKQPCTIVLPWGKYEYQCLPMGLCNSPDIFQEKMSCLMANLEYLQAYIDDLLIITKGTYLEHLQKLATILTELQQAGLKVNANKPWFAQEELEYLGYWITRNRIQPAQEKVGKQLLRHVERSDVLAPLAALTSTTTPWKWMRNINTHSI